MKKVISTFWSKENPLKNYTKNNKLSFFYSVQFNTLLVSELPLLMPSLEIKLPHCSVFLFFFIFFQANCECLSQLQLDCESVDVLEELKALCVFDTITALIRSLELYSHGSAVLHTD